VLCGKVTTLAAGLQMCHADKGRPVCAACARRAAPALAALQGLANAAEHVGRINRHTVVPPLAALMELARAAESYSSSARPAQASERLAA
jgi:hypothetical protein